MTNEPISLQPITTANAPLLWMMLYLAIHVPEGEPAPPLNIIFRPDLARYARNWGQPGDLGITALDAQGLPAGAAWLRLLTGVNRGYGWVDDAIPELSVAVLPQYRGQGIGTQLIRALLDQARARFPGVSLSVSAGNPAENLYRRLGFVVVQQDDHSRNMLLRFEKETI